MTVTFFRLTMTGRTQEYLNTVADFINTQIDNVDLHDTIGDGQVHTNQMDDGNYRLNVDMYIKHEIPVQKYEDIFFANLGDLDLNEIISVKVIKNENCSHDSPTPQPDVVETVYEYNGAN